MARGKAFVEVLDEVLAGYRPEEPVRPPRVASGYATPSIFRFEATEMKRGASPAPWVPVSGGTTPPPRPPRPSRALSPRQREAFDAFVQLGARINDDFTDAELRSVFRSLALRYHPDRHPGSTDGERAHLSVHFAELHDAYESLKSVSVCSN
jgi:hypothetical protein